MSKRERDAQSTAESQAEKDLLSATEGFDLLFSNRLAEARTHLTAGESPFHYLGLGVCTFLEAALGMEVSGLFTFPHSSHELIFLKKKKTVSTIRRVCSLPVASRSRREKATEDDKVIISQEPFSTGY